MGPYPAVASVALLAQNSDSWRSDDEFDTEDPLHRQNAKRQHWWCPDLGVSSAHGHWVAPRLLLQR